MLKDNLRTIRLSRKITQQDLAKGLNYSQQAIAKWESGQSYPDLSGMMLLSDYLKVGFDCLIRKNPVCAKDYLPAGVKTTLIHAFNHTSTITELGVEFSELSDLSKLEIIDEIFGYLKVRVHRHSVKK